MPAFIDSIVSVGSTWHGEGVAMPIGTKILSPQVNELAGLTWKALSIPNVHPNPVTKKLEETPRSNAIIRSDTGAVIGVVGDRYEIFQNDDAPKFLDNLVDSDDGLYESAGALQGGSTTWWLMQRPEHVYVAGMKSEELAPYLFLANTFDMSQPVTLGFTLVRIVCWNTLRAALRSARQSYRIRHTASMQGRYQEAREALNMSFKHTASVLEVANQLVQRRFGEAEITQTLDALVPLKDADGEEKTGRGRTMAESTRSGILSVLNGRDNLAPIKETAWGFLQAVSDYHDHSEDAIRRTTATSNAGENRFKSRFGLTATENLTTKTFNILTASLN